ncbi:MAG: MFS transporter [Bacteroidales bacterium]
MNTNTEQQINSARTDKRRNAWSWIPTLYFAQGLPYVAVMTIAVIMYKRLGLSNTDIALYTSWLNLPWVIKPLWSPFIDLAKTKRWWITTMQSLIAVGFAGIAFFIPTEFWLQVSLAFFWLLAFASATHDIAADGFYMLGLTTGEQSFFVGIRNTCYRFSTLFGQGALVWIAGALEEGLIFPSMAGKISLAWSLIFYLLAGLFVCLFFYNSYILPRPKEDYTHHELNAAQMMKDFVRTFVSYFQKKDLFVIFFFLLTYRLGEAQLGKLTTPFLLDNMDAGGLGLATRTVGFAYGTLGVIALLAGGIVGGLLVSRHGFKQWIMPMALAINIPDLLYVYLAANQPEQIEIILGCVMAEQFGYGFGFTAYMLYLIYVSQGEFKTAHYAIGTGFMALGMMIPGMFAGMIQEYLGYTQFFWWVCLCTLPGIYASYLVMKRMDTTFGKK